MISQAKPAGTEKNWPFLRILLSITVILHAYLLFYFLEPIYTYGKLATSIKWQLAASAGALLIAVEIGLLVSTWTGAREKIEAGFNSLFHLLNKIGVINILLVLVSVSFYPLLVSGQPGFVFDGTLIRISLLWSIMLLAGIWIRALIDRRKIFSKWLWFEILSASLVFTATAYLAAVYSTEITDYPFTLYWSEASRYYYGSLFVSKQLYGSSSALPVLHPSQYLLHTVPFLFQDLAVTWHRAWHALLWVGMTLVTAAGISTRFSYTHRLRRWIFIGWIFTFLLIGPVFYHLQIIILLITLGYNQQRLKSPRLRAYISTAALLLAAVWAGISRVNWFPVPGLLAAVILIFEQPVEDAGPESSSHWFGANSLRYLMKLISLVVLSTLAALATNSIYILISGNPAGEFASSFTSNLLWYRLLPNPTFPPGILPASLFISLPFVAIILYKLFIKYGGIPTWRLVSSIRWLSIIPILLVLFSGGLVVSTKIGGGSNLHNMDAYLVMLALVTAFLFYDQVKIDRYPPSGSSFQKALPTIAKQSWLKDLTQDPLNNPSLQAIFNLSLSLAFLTPVVVTLSLPMYKTAFPDDQTITRSISKIKEFTDIARVQGGEALFITDRHLLTFDYIEDVPLVPEYEKVFLMEMAMAENVDYLERFHSDIRNQRFALIVSEPLYFERKGSYTRFGEENNAWVDHIAKFIHCYYEPQRTILEVNIQLLTPRTDAGICP